MKNPLLYAHYEVELYDDDHCYEWETWSAFLKDGLFTFCWDMIEKQPDDGVYHTYWELDQENTDKLFRYLGKEYGGSISPQTASGWGEEFLQIELLAENLLNIVHAKFNGQFCKKAFESYCAEHDIEYHEYWG